MRISVRSVGIEVDDQGPASGEPLLLIMGLGMQLTGWPDALVQRLVSHGFRVIRIDNRDAGLSQSFDHHGVPSLLAATLRYALHLPVASPYKVRDMADDALGVLDALKLERAHVCGASMGGMIAQQMAVRHPQRVKSLTLIMTSSGSRRLPGPTLKVRGAMISRPEDANNVQSIIEHYVKLYKLIGSPGYPADDAYLYERLGQSVRRSYRPQGTARQMVAIAADGNRSPLLGAIKVPTQIIHGKDDPLVPVEAGHDLAKKIAGAELDVISGMGHDLPAPLWPRFVAGITSAAGRA